MRFVALFSLYLLNVFRDFAGASLFQTSTIWHSQVSGKGRVYQHTLEIP